MTNQFLPGCAQTYRMCASLAELCYLCHITEYKWQCSYSTSPGCCVPVWHRLAWLHSRVTFILYNEQRTQKQRKQRTTKKSVAPKAAWFLLPRSSIARALQQHAFGSKSWLRQPVSKETWTMFFVGKACSIFVLEQWPYIYSLWRLHHPSGLKTMSRYLMCPGWIRSSQATAPGSNRSGRPPTPGPIVVSRLLTPPGRSRSRSRGSRRVPEPTTAPAPLSTACCGDCCRATWSARRSSNSSNSNNNSNNNTNSSSSSSSSSSRGGAGGGRGRRWGSGLQRWLTFWPLGRPRPRRVGVPVRAPQSGPARHQSYRVSELIQNRLACRNNSIRSILWQSNATHD